MLMWKLQRAMQYVDVVRDICLASEAYHDGEAVVSLDAVFLTHGFGVVIGLSFRGKVHVVVYDLTPLHEEHGSVLVQNVLVQIAKDLVGDFPGLHVEERGKVRREESAL